MDKSNFFDCTFTRTGEILISGGAGEGKQNLTPEGNIPNKNEVKTDAILPAYCNPPNPCPVGFTGKKILFIRE